MTSIHRCACVPSPALAAAIVAAIVAVAIAAGTAIAADTVATRTEAGNSYYSGGELTLDEAVPGDLFAAGGRVALRKNVGGDAALAGGSVDIQGDIGQDLRAAGGDVRIEGLVGGELAAVGGTVTVADAAAVAGPTLLAGGDVIVAGRLGRGAKIYAKRIDLRGEVDGNARFYAQEIVFGPQARIDGDLFYASAGPLPEEMLGEVSGSVVREKTPDNWHTPSTTSFGSRWFHPFFFLSMLVSGMVLYLLFPRAIGGARTAIAEAPIASIAAGVAVLFVVPPLALVLMLTLVGIPLGLGLFALYPLLLMLGYLTAAFFIGRKLADVLRQPPEFGRGREALFLAGALVVLLLASAIPLLGWLFVLLSFAAGTGGWALWAARGYRAKPPANRDVPAS